MGWTGERVEILKKLWLEGLSAIQIAKQLGGVTRNGVIGKIHRLGLAGRAQPSRPAFKAPRPPRPQPANPGNFGYRKAGSVSAAPTKAPPPPAVIIELPGTATSLTLGAHMCKWPIGDPATDDFSFCGRHTPGKDSFCVDHARVAYQPANSTQHRRTNSLERDLRRYI